MLIQPPLMFVTLKEHLQIEIAKKGTSSMEWFCGFKLHLVINDKGKIMEFKLTKATTDDRKPVHSLTKDLIGKLVGVRGYISQKLFDALFEKGLPLIIKIKKNMKNKLIFYY